MLLVWFGLKKILTNLETTPKHNICTMTNHIVRKTESYSIPHKL